MLLALRNLYETQIEYWPGIAVGIGASEVIVDPWTGTQLPGPETRYKVAQTGLSSCGDPYFAAVPAEPGTGIGGGENSMTIVVTLDSLPERLNSDDEPHFITSWHEYAPGGRELFSIAITPNGRVCAKAAGTPLLMSPIGVIAADGLSHSITIQSFSVTLTYIAVDGVVVVAALLEPSEPEGMFSNLGLPVRFMLYNGVDGLTRCPCTIHQCHIGPEGTNPLRWPIDENSGLSIRDQEYVSDGLGGNADWRDRSDIIIPPYGGSYPAFVSDYTDSWALEVGWYDPSVLSFPQLYGDPPTASVASCARRRRSTQFTRRNPVNPNYRPVVTT